MTDTAFNEWITQAAPDWATRCRFLPDVLERDRHQPETTVPIWDYLDRVLTDTRIEQGQRMSAQWDQALRVIEKRFNISRFVILAIWGLETNYGMTCGDVHVPSALATLAFGAATQRRRIMFLSQLQALAYINHLDSDDLHGSWAGAMGHTQFMPQAYRDYAVAYDGNGPADIWGNDPRDALTSTAHYLMKHGAVSSDFDVVFVELDTHFDYSTLGDDFIGSEKLGLVPHTSYRGFAPYGAHGPAVFLGPNARAILGYNHSLHYVLAVMFLAHRLADINIPDILWPVDLDILGRTQLCQIQTALVALGYNTNGVDGIWGTASQRALQNWQKSSGRVADGYPTLDALHALLDR